MNRTFLCVLVLFCPVSFAFRLQSVAVKGTIMCGEEPLANVQIKLVDEDDGPDPDDVLEHGFTNEDGSFYLSGSERELTNIDPILKVYHDCNDYGIPCERKWRIGIPDKYISEGRTPTVVFDMGFLNAEVELEGETRDCVH
uniref:Transthyretin-like protein 46 n=1 Tax=Plectus sambesii TaxID=2011161 RepID=A0A914WDW9_9BILA